MQQFMENLRQLFQRMSTSARDTSQSASAYIDRQRKVVALRSEVRKAEDEQRTIYITMGRKVYALHRKDKVANKDLLRSCHEIDELNTLIEARNAQIEALLAEPDEDDVEIDDDTEIPEDAEIDQSEPDVEDDEEDDAGGEPSQAETLPPPKGDSAGRK